MPCKDPGSARAVFRSSSISLISPPQDASHEPKTVTAARALSTLVTRVAASTVLRKEARSNPVTDRANLDAERMRLEAWAKTLEARERALGDAGAVINGSVATQNHPET